MIFYYWIVNLPGVPVREISAVDAPGAAAAREALSRLAERWPGFESVALYEGGRLVSVLTSSSHGLAPEQPQTRACAA